MKALVIVLMLLGLAACSEEVRPDTRCPVQGK